MMDGDVDRCAQSLQLIDGGGAVNVGGDEERPQALLLQINRELGGDGCLADTLQAGEHDRGHATRLLKGSVDGAHQLDELFFADLYEVLPGRDLVLAATTIFDPRLDLFAEGAFFYAIEERTRDLEVDVGFQKRHAHIAQRFIDAFFIEFANALESVGGVFESLRDGLEHGLLRKARRLAAA